MSSYENDLKKFTINDLIKTGNHRDRTEWLNKTNCQDHSIVNAFKLFMFSPVAMSFYVDEAEGYLRSETIEAYGKKLAAGKEVVEYLNSLDFDKTYLYSIKCEYQPDENNAIQEFIVIRTATAKNVPI